MTRARDVADSALVHIATETFSAVASQSIDDVFSATYDNYRFVTSLIGTGIAAVRIYLRDISGNITGANYNFQLLDAQSTSISGSWTTGQTSGRLGTCTSTRENIITADMCNPFLSKATTYIGYSMDSRPGFSVFGNEHTLTNSYTGISLFSSTGTMTGTLSVYGYRK